MKLTDVLPYQRTYYVLKAEDGGLLQINDGVCIFSIREVAETFSITHKLDYSVKPIPVEGLIEGMKHGYLATVRHNGLWHTFGDEDTVTKDNV